MIIELISFSDTGKALGEKITEALLTEEKTVIATDGRNQASSLNTWASERFDSCDAFVFVGAIGIAVRAIAPFIKSKMTDPAVVVVEENAKFVIPILSGHVGRANRLAKQLAEKLGSVCVITTATDANNLFAVDNWAVMQNLTIMNPEHIKKISAKLLEGKTAYLYTEFPIISDIPRQVERCDDAMNSDIYISFSKPPKEDALWLCPKILTLGIGCRRGKSCEEIENAVDIALENFAISKKAVLDIATIDLKQDEAGLLEFARKYRYPLHFYTSEQLNSIEGQFTASDFVKSVIGAENVCERSAVFASGGEILFPKHSNDGVTVAAAVAPYTISFEETI